VAKASKSKKAETTRLIALFAIGAAVAAVAVIGWNYYQASVDQTELAESEGGKTDPSMVELMRVGPLEEMVMGSADAPNTIVEYASMTCSHCADFQTDVFPELKAKYIDTGKAKYMLREFPLDTLATAAFMVARCSGSDRYYPMVDALFETQSVWAVPGSEGKDKLLQISRQAGFSKERFDECLADKELFKKIVDVRDRGHEAFQIDSTPTFFVNGKRLTDYKIEDFDAVLEGADKTAGASPSP
jgi:protein-disulfide isomerase